MPGSGRTPPAYAPPNAPTTSCFLDIIGGLPVQATYCHDHDNRTRQIPLPCFPISSHQRYSRSRLDNTSSRTPVADSWAERLLFARRCPSVAHDTRYVPQFHQASRHLHVCQSINNSSNNVLHASNTRDVGGHRSTRSYHQIFPERNPPVLETSSGSLYFPHFHPPTATEIYVNSLNPRDRRSLSFIEHQARRPGVPFHILSMLPVERISTSMLGSTNNELSTCMVCHLEYNEDEVVRRLPCFHIFHRSCIDRWLFRACPVCRISVLDGLNMNVSLQNDRPESTEGTLFRDNNVPSTILTGGRSSEGGEIFFSSQYNNVEGRSFERNEPYVAETTEIQPSNTNHLTFSVNRCQSSSINLQPESSNELETLQLDQSFVIPSIITENTQSVNSEAISNNDSLEIKSSTGFCTLTSNHSTVMTSINSDMMASSSSNTFQNDPSSDNTTASTNDPDVTCSKMVNRNDIRTKSKVWRAKKRRHLKLTKGATRHVSRKRSEVVSSMSPKPGLRTPESTSRRRRGLIEAVMSGEPRLTGEPSPTLRRVYQLAKDVKLPFPLTSRTVEDLNMVTEEKSKNYSVDIINQFSLKFNDHMQKLLQKKNQI